MNLELLNIFIIIKIYLTLKFVYFFFNFKKLIFVTKDLNETSLFEYNNQNLISIEFI